MKTKNTFLNKSKILPALYAYMVYVEARVPLLFACKDEYGHLYICSCHCSNGEKQEWIIAHTTYAKLLNLLTDHITINEMFTVDNPRLFIATYSNNSSKTEVKSVSLDELAPEILPTPGYTIDADPGEFDEEIEILTRELEDSKKYLYVNATKTFETMFRTFDVHLVCNPSNLFYDERKKENCILESKKTLVRCTI